MSTVGKVTLALKSNNNVRRTENLISRSADALMGERKVLPKPIECDTLVKGETKKKITNDGGCGGFDNSWY